MSARRVAVVLRAPVSMLAMIVGATLGASACIEGEIPIGGDRLDKNALFEAEAACDARCEMASNECPPAEDCQPECEAQFERVTPCEAKLAALLACASPGEESSLACGARGAVDDACVDAERALLTCLADRDAPADDERLRVSCDDVAHCACFFDGDSVGSCDMLVATSALESPLLSCCAPMFRARLARAAAAR